MHVPQSAASDNVQQNETCIVTSLNTDNTDQFIQKKMFWREKLTQCIYITELINCQVMFEVFISVAMRLMEQFCHTIDGLGKCD